MVVFILLNLVSLVIRTYIFNKEVGAQVFKAAGRVLTLMLAVNGGGDTVSVWIVTVLSSCIKFRRFGGVFPTLFFI